MNFVTFKYFVIDNIEKIIIVVCLFILVGLGFSYYEHTQLNKFTKQSLAIVDAEDFMKAGLFGDYEKYQRSVLSPSMEDSMSLLNKYQTEPFAYLFFTSRIISFLHRDNISYGDKQVFKVTPAMKADAQKKAQEVLALYKKNENNLAPTTSKKIEELSKQYFTIFGKSYYDQVINVAKIGDREVTVQVKNRLSQLQPENYAVWHDYYQKLDKFKADPKNNPNPSKPDTYLK